MELICILISLRHTENKRIYHFAVRKKSDVIYCACIYGGWIWKTGQTLFFCKQEDFSRFLCYTASPTRTAAVFSSVVLCLCWGRLLWNCILAEDFIVCRRDSNRWTSPRGKIYRLENVEASCSEWVAYFRKLLWALRLHSHFKIICWCSAKETQLFCWRNSEWTGQLLQWNHMVMK